MSNSEARETADVETSSDAYASRFAGPVGAWMLEVQARAVTSLLGPDRTRTLLEVGGGHGQLAFPLADAGWACTVVGSEPACGRRIEPLVRAGRCRFVAGDLLKLPFEDRAFDTVLCIRLLTHCARWPELARELCRVARRSVVVEYPLHEGLHRLAPLFFGMKKKVEGNTRHWRPFRHREVTAAFEACGFREERVIRQFFWPLVLHRMLKRPGLSRRLEAAAAGMGLTRRMGSPALSSLIPKGT